MVQEVLQRRRDLEDEEHSGWPLEVDSWSLKLILLKLHEKLLKNSVLTILPSFCIWSKLERWKNLINGGLILLLLLNCFSRVRLCATPWTAAHQAPHELTVNQKIVILKCHHLLFCVMTVNHFSVGLWCVMKSGFYTITGDDQLSGWTEKKLQSIS